MLREGKELISKTVRGKNGKGMHKIQHGAYSLVRAYYADDIDRRTHLGILLSELETEYAAHCGFSSLAECSVTLKEKIRLAIGNKLFQMTYIPSPTTVKDLRASENSLNRILTELGLKPAQKDVSLDQYIEEKYA